MIAPQMIYTSNELNIRGGKMIIHSIQTISVQLSLLLRAVCVLFRINCFLFKQRLFRSFAESIESGMIWNVRRKILRVSCQQLISEAAESNRFENDNAWNSPRLFISNDIIVSAIIHLSYVIHLNLIDSSSNRDELSGIAIKFTWNINNAFWASFICSN